MCEDGEDSEDSEVVYQNGECEGGDNGECVRVVTM